MEDIIELDKTHSTTRRVIKADPNVVMNAVKQSHKPEDKFETVLFLPVGEGRQGEGGLRTQGYFKVDGIISDDLSLRGASATRQPPANRPDIARCVSNSANSNCEGHSTPEAQPLITIITVVFNGEKFLEETILSVINQTYDNVEYIIIDGGSTDGTLDIIKKYEHAIDYWVSEKDKGIYDAMNKGIDLATGDWINFMNAGDEFYSLDVLDKVSQNLCVKVDVIAGYVNYIFSKESHKTKFLENKLGPFNIRFSHHQGSFIKMDKMKKFKYDSNFFIRGDTDFFAKIYNENGQWLKIDVIIANYNVEGVSSSISWKNFKEEIEVGEKYINFFWLKHFFYYIAYVLPRFFVRKIMPTSLSNKLRVIFSR